MFSPSSQVIVGLEVGTAKVCAAVGEVTPEGALSIIGVGQSRSHGVRKGEIVEPTLAAEDIRNAIANAEDLANAEVRSVFLGITGGHVRGTTKRGRHSIPSVDRGITEEDVADVVANAKGIQLPTDHESMHVFRQHFTVDGKPGLPNPVGLVGAQLEVDLHVVHGLNPRIETVLRAVRDLQLEVEDVVFTGLASALAVLTPQDKELGALVIDLGAGATEYVVYTGNIVRHSGVLPVGGDHVTNDLAYGLKISMSRAEALKIGHGSAVVDPGVRGQTVSLTVEPGLPERSVNLEHLHRIMSTRVEEIFEIIAEEVDQAGLLEDLRGGVFLCGGGARIPEVQRLAERVFGLPAAIGRSQSINGLVATLDQPEFATAIGLVKFGSFKCRKREPRPTLGQNLKSVLSKLLPR